MTGTDGVLRGDLDEVLGRGRSIESNRGLHVEVIKVHLDQSNIRDMCVVKDEPDLNLEKTVDSKTYRMRLKAIQVEAKKETVVAGKANSIKEEIETKAEQTVV